MSESHQPRSLPVETGTAQGQSRVSPRRRRLPVMSLGGGLALFAMLGGWAIIADRDDRGTDPRAAAIAQAAFEEVTGVQILRVAITAGGGILDLRYRVLDPDKAIVVHDKDNPPAIIHEASNRTANRPFMHHKKARDMHLAVTYYELLLNPGEIVKPGDPVTVVLGGAKLEHVIVQ